MAVVCDPLEPCTTCNPLDPDAELHSEAAHAAITAELVRLTLGAR